MLIYVDKKKERQKKIRRLLLILFSLFFITLNLWQFNTSLNHSDQSLTDYQSIKHLNLWYNNADIVYLFTDKKNNTAALIIPETFNQENATTIALALSKLPQQKYNIILAPNISENDSLRNLIKIFLPQAEFNSTANAPDVIIANDTKIAAQHIIKNKLFPRTLNYKHTKKIQEIPALKNFIKNTFPPLPLPQNTLEQESQNLQSFISTHERILKDFVFLDKEPPFTSQNLFLQNIRLCLKTKENNLSCALDTTVSLKQNIINAKADLPKEDTINKVYLLTSDMKTTPQTTTRFNKDEGLRFVYQSRNALLLPEDMKLLDNPLKAFYILKEKTGINPLFDAPDMYFYKIKIKEITHDEDI
jgi:hypothetical protein